MATTTLSQDQIDTFIAHGWLTVRQAIPAADAARMLGHTWQHLRELGIHREDRSTWPTAWPQPASLVRHPTFRSVPSPRLIGAIDDLVGAGRWQHPLHRWGFLRVSWPEPGEQPWDLVHQGWHWDASPLDPGAALFALVHIGHTVPGGGGTLIVNGSHRLVAQQVAQQPPTRRVKKSRVIQDLARTHPWFARLLMPPRDPEADAQRRRQELMAQPTIDRDGHQLQVIECTGAPGDITLCHPSILHAVNLNRSDHPRIMRLCFLGLRSGATRSGTPVERSMQPWARPALPTPVDSLPVATTTTAPAPARVVGGRVPPAGGAPGPAQPTGTLGLSCTPLPGALQAATAAVRRRALRDLVRTHDEGIGSREFDLSAILLEVCAHDRSRRLRLAALRFLAQRAVPACSGAPLQHLLARRTHPRIRRRVQHLLDRIASPLSAAMDAAGVGSHT